MSIQDLREQRDNKTQEYRTILDRNPGRLQAEIKRKLDTLEADITEIDDRIGAEERAMNMVSKRLQANDGRSFSNGGKTGASDDQIKALATFCRSGDVSGFG